MSGWTPDNVIDLVTTVGILVLFAFIVYMVVRSDS